MVGTPTRHGELEHDCQEVLIGANAAITEFPAC